MKVFQCTYCRTYIPAAISGCMVILGTAHQLSPPPTLCHHSHTPPISLLGFPLTTTLHHPATQCPYHLSPHHHLEQPALPPLFLVTHNSLKSHLTLSHLSHPHLYHYNQLTFHLMLCKRDSRLRG